MFKKYTKWIFSGLSAIIVFVVFSMTDGCDSVSVDNSELNQLIKTLKDENESFFTLQEENFITIESQKERIKDISDQLESCQNKKPQIITEVVTRIEYITKYVDCPDNGEDLQTAFNQCQSTNSKLLETITDQGNSIALIRSEKDAYKKQVDKYNEEKERTDSKIFVEHNAKLESTYKFKGEIIGQPKFVLSALVSDSDFSDLNPTSKIKRNILGVTGSINNDFSDFSDQVFTGLEYHRISGKKERFIWGLGVETNVNSEFNYQKWNGRASLGIRF